MKNNNKKIWTLFLLFLAAVPIFFSVFFLLEQNIIRKRMHELLEKSSLQTVTIPDADINWIHPNEEIYVEGKLFDIKSCTYIDGYYILTGLYDKEETELVKEFQHSTQQNSGTDTESLFLLFQLWHTQFSSAEDRNDLANLSTTVNAHFISPSLPSAFISILTPPPQIVLQFS